MALWLAAAMWALSSGVRLRREAGLAAGRAEKLDDLLRSCPAITVLVRGDGRLEAQQRLARWLGRERPLSYISELTDPQGGLRAADAEELAKDVTSAQKAGKRFARALHADGSVRTLLAVGAPADPAVAAPGSVLIWIFDATDSQKEIEALEQQKADLTAALDAVTAIIEAAPIPMWHRTADMKLALVNSAYVKAVDAASAHDVIASGVELVESFDGQSPGDAEIGRAHV